MNFRKSILLTFFILAITGTSAHAATSIKIVNLGFGDQSGIGGFVLFRDGKVGSTDNYDDPPVLTLYEGIVRPLLDAAERFSENDKITAVNPGRFSPEERNCKSGARTVVYVNNSKMKTAPIWYEFICEGKKTSYISQNPEAPALIKTMQDLNTLLGGIYTYKAKAQNN